MEKIHILLFVLFTPFMLNGQENLFSNPSFEEITECLNEKTKEGSKLVNSWGHAINQDTFPTNPCDTAWNLYLNAIESRTGIASQYMLAYYNDPRVLTLDSRSYLVTELKKPLQADGFYYFKMYAKSIYNNPENYCFSNGQGIAFSKVVPKPGSGESEGPLKIVPVVENEKLVDTNWTKISGCFKAKGGEKYAIIGNFKPKEKTLIKRIKEPTATTIDPNAPDFVAGFINRSLTGSNLIDDVELIPLSLDFPKDTAICDGESLLLDVKNDLQATYKWQDGSTSSQYTITKSGTYKVVIDYTFGSEFCKVEQIFNVDVLPKYREKPLVDTVICQFKSILLKVGTGRRDDTIRWQDNIGSKDTLRVSKNGTYTAKISNACGNYIESYKVNFIRCDINVFVPNAFSPNGDNTNDTFAPFIQADFPITDYEFAVYNRWGSQVFFSRDREASWDAMFRNQLSESGLYAWYLKVTGQLGSKTVQKLETGDVMLMR
jgi:gliding motility-associated-like protein